MKNVFLFVVLLSSMSAGFAQANLQLTMVNPETHEVTITNMGNVSQNASSFFLCNFPAYFSLGSLVVLSGSTVIAAGASVTVIFPQLNDTDGECGLYANSANFGSAANMRDYFQWGSAGHQRESVAVTAGYWTAGTFVGGNPAYNYIGTATDQGAAFWTSVVTGCTYSSATNFNPAATKDDGSCTFASGTCPSDLNGDGVVGFSDLNTFLATYGLFCP